MPDLAYDTQRRLWYRPNTHDDKIVLKEKGTYVRRLKGFGGPYSVLLDLGANIGSISVLAVEELGFAHAVAVEPDPGNLAVLRNNAAGRPISVIDGAVGPVGQTTLTVSSGGDARGAFSTTSELNSRHAANEKTEVTCWTLRALNELCTTKGNLTVVKCDIEGGEHAIADDLAALADLSPTVKRLAMEVHLYPGDGMRRAAWDLYWKIVMSQQWDVDLRHSPRGIKDGAGTERWNRFWTKQTEGVFTFDRVFTSPANL